MHFLTYGGQDLGKQNNGYLKNDADQKPCVD